MGIICCFKDSDAGLETSVAAGPRDSSSRAKKSNGFSIGEPSVSYQHDMNFPTRHISERPLKPLNDLKVHLNGN